MRTRGLITGSRITQVNKKNANIMPKLFILLIREKDFSIHIILIKRSQKKGQNPISQNILFIF